MIVTNTSQVLVPAAAGSKSFYRPELDALRFIAFFSVFLYHCSFLRPPGEAIWDSVMYAGAFGMSLFFTLSSYLITTLLIKERDKTGTIAIRSFYIRRVLRIWPLYFTFLFSVWAIGHYYHPWAVTTGTLASFSLLFGNWYIIFVPISGPIMPLWSISLEEQFYLVWPTLFRSTSRKTFIKIACVLFAASLTAIVFLSVNRKPFWEIWWNTFAQMQYFALGAVMAFYSHKIFQADLRRPKRFFFAACAVSLWIAGGFANHYSAVGVQPALLLVVSYLASGLGCAAFFQAFWGAKSIPDAWIYLGKVSYGLYVFHKICLNTASYVWTQIYGRQDYLPIALIAFALTLLCASLSFPLIEKPFLRWKKTFEVVRSR